MSYGRDVERRLPLPKRTLSTSDRGNGGHHEEIAMKSALRCAMFSLLMCVPARAYEIESGAVMACDTQEQVERFVQLFDGNQQLAINAVNSEERNPSACAVIDAAYVSGPALGVARSRSYAFEITPIVVVGTTTQHGYRQVQPVLFFIPVNLKEFAV
jgi:hypothetical protein